MSTGSTASTQAAREFLGSGQAAQIHKAWDTTNSTYDPVLDKYVPSQPRTIRAVADGPTKNFEKLMATLQKAFPEDDSVSKFNIRDAHNWDEVLLTAGMAAERYKGKKKGLRGLFTRVGRTIGDVNPAISPFLSQLPQGEYTSVICGGIILIFNAFKKMSEVRDKVLNTLGDSPLLLEQVEDFVRLYPDDQRLNENAIKLYIALLITLEAIVKWLEHGFWDRLKVLGQQDFYASKLYEKVDFLNKRATDVRTRADTCDKEKTTEIAKAIEIQLSMIGELRDVVNQRADDQLAATSDLANQVGGGFDTVRKEMSGNTKETDEAIEGISRKMSDRFGDMQTNIGDGFEDLGRGIGTGFDHTNTKMESSFTEMSNTLKSMTVHNDENLSKFEKRMMESVKMAAQNALKTHLSDEQRGFEWQKEAELQRERAESLALQLQMSNLELARTRTPAAQAQLSQPEAIRLLGNISRLGISNIQHYIRVARTIDADPAIVDMVMGAPKFQFWLTSAISQTLFLTPSPMLAKISPGTFITATLAQILLEMPPAITLVHFCRGHGGAEQDSEPASFLMASLISQLLATREYDLQQWSQVTSIKDHYEALEQRDINYLCSFFKYLVNSLPYGTIFCLIDDFFHLEQYTDAESLSAVVRTFSELVETSTAGRVVVFKALAMTPDRKGSIVRFAAEDDLLSLGMDTRMQARGDSMMSKQQRYQMEYARRKHGGPSAY